LLTTGDLIDVVIGAEGTLGVVTDISVDLALIPAHTASLRVALRSRGDLVAALEAIRAVDPATLEFLDASFLRLVQHRVATPEYPGLLAASAGFLLADIEGHDAEEVAVRLDLAAAAVAPFALDVQTALAPEAIENLWAVRHGASAILAGLTDGRRSLQVIEDGCVPPAHLAEYLDAIDAATGRQRIDAVVFGHAGDGHVHVNLLPNLLEADWAPRVRAVFDDVTAAVVRLGGTTSGEHGAGRLRAGTLAAMYGETVMTVFRAIKQSFDPDGLWNPGVLLADGRDPFQHLKVGHDAAVLPDGVAEQLRAIEIGAAWGESRWSEPRRQP
jgi:FAD/FMN-containing dehydrogenase